MTFEPVSPEKVERLEFFLKGDKLALLFCLDILWIAHTWDDLIDKDKPVGEEQINQAFIKCLVDIPTNPFFEQLKPALMPMMYNSLCLWLESNELQQGDLHDKVNAFAITRTVLDIIHFCIVAKGGSGWAREVGPEFWRLFGVSLTELNDCLGAEYA